MVTMYFREPKFSETKLLNFGTMYVMWFNVSMYVSFIFGHLVLNHGKTFKFAIFFSKNKPMYSLYSLRFFILFFPVFGAGKVPATPTARIKSCTVHGKNF